MTNTQKRIIAAVISTLDETNGGPESMLYLALGCSLDEWQMLKGAMVHVDLIKESMPNYLVLTDKGRSLAKQISGATA